MYQNKVSLIGFLGRDAEVRNANNRSFTTFSLATKSSYKDKKKRRVCLADRMAPLRGLWQARRVCRNADQRRPCPDRRRAPQPRNTAKNSGFKRPSGKFASIPS